MRRKTEGKCCFYDTQGLTVDAVSSGEREDGASLPIAAVSIGKVHSLGCRLCLFQIQGAVFCKSSG
jgi:hypothetical protein